jgi:hypothetical protein
MSVKQLLITLGSNDQSYEVEKEIGRMAEVSLVCDSIHDILIQ